MPPQPGEDRLITVFADIHYYFATPTVHPLLHRFDKASYLYIYYNSTRQTSRIEVANHPGTPDQDAFSGHLDSCRIINSHSFPTLMTLIVDGLGSGTSPHSAKSDRDPDEWRLPSADPRDPGKQPYRIHTIDVYFWAEEDARSVIQTLQRLLDPRQLDVADFQIEQHSDLPKEQESTRHEDTIHPVVQNLENVAISDPAYQNGQTRGLQQQDSQHSQPQQSISPQPAANVTSHPPQGHHPAYSVSPVSALSSTDGTQKHYEGAAQSFAPIPYNPAAPAAPEPISHREDTPPPVDDGSNSGLAAAALHDRVPEQPSSQPWTGVPQLNQYVQYSATSAGAVPGQVFSSLPPPPATTTSFAGPPSATGSGVHSEQSPHTSSIAAQHYIPTQTSLPPNLSSDPVETPGSQFYSSITGQPHKPLAHVQPQYADYLSAKTQSTVPPGGYSPYNYNQSSQGHVTHGYNLHSQVYIPTEAEAKAEAKKQSSRFGRADSTQAGAGRKESRADKVEKGVGKLFKRVDKKFGLT